MRHVQSAGGGTGPHVRAGKMDALVTVPGAGGVRQRSIPVPERGTNEVLVRSLLTGVDGTDEALVARGEGKAPEGEDFLVLGHECLGEVVEAPAWSGLEPGDRVLPLVREGCGACEACAQAAPDLCPDPDSVIEHGIRGAHGFMRALWTADPQNLVPAPRHLGDLAVLAEPLSIVVKALQHATSIRSRIPWVDPDEGWSGARALLAGTGSLGTLGAFLLRSEGVSVWAMDRTPDDAFRSLLLRRIGVTHFNSHDRSVGDVAGEVGGFDLVIEATGAPSVTFDAVRALAGNGVMCMLGVPAGSEEVRMPAGEIMKLMVLRNQVLFGSVNSNRRHFDRALTALAGFRERWNGALGDVITHSFRPGDSHAAFAGDGTDQVKKVIDWR